MMKAKEILTHFLNQANWVNRDDTVDKIIVGNPEKEIKTVLVTWISSLAAIKTAVEKKVDMLITHEPTFWKHKNELENWDKSEIGKQKMQYIKDNGLVILRNHDVWDKMPKIGIPWAWAKFLGIEGEPAQIGANGYQHRYDIQPITLKEFATNMAKKTASLGEPMVQVVGASNQLVSKIGIGTGCGCNIDIFMEMGCDLSIVCDDGSCYWSGIQQAEDREHPVIRVNHGTSEEPGMKTLTDYINKNLDGVAAEHLPHGSTFRLMA